MSGSVLVADTRRDERRRDLIALTRGSWASERIDLLIEELDSGPAGVAWVEDLIVDVMNRGDLQSVAELARSLALYRWGSDYLTLHDGAGCALAPPERPPESRVSAPKLRHDADQFRLLRRRERVGAEFDRFVDEYEAIADELSWVGPNQRIAMPPDIEARIGPIYNRIVYLADEARVERALSPSWDRTAVQRTYLERPPGVVVVDDFLSEAALAGLRRFCEESTVWSGNKYASGRLGSLLFNGFNCPVLIQVAEELQAAFPEVIGDRHPLTQLWGFKNSAYLPSDTNVHADFAAVNVNFWITPESANLDPDSGGLVVYDVGAPLSWDFAAYNESPRRIYQHLSEQNARAAVIPYRANRAIIFNSDLFHGTAGVRFRPDYESRRVNITMLFGKRQYDDHHPAASKARTVAPPPPTAWRSGALRSARRR